MDPHKADLIARMLHGNKPPGLNPSPETSDLLSRVRSFLAGVKESPVTAFEAQPTNSMTRIRHSNPKVKFKRTGNSQFVEFTIMKIPEKEESSEQKKTLIEELN